MAADPPTPHNRYRNANCTEPIMGSIWYPMRTRSRPVRTALITEEVVKEKTSGRQTWKSKALADPDANSDDSGVNRDEEGHDGHSYRRRTPHRNRTDGMFTPAVEHESPLAHDRQSQGNQNIQNT